MKKIFLNKEEKRLKAGWRILLFLLLFLFFSSLIFAVKPLLGDISKREYLENYSLILVSILSLGATISVFFSRKWWDRKSFISLGLKWNVQAFKDMVFGFFLSAAMAGLFLGVLILFGLIEMNGVSFQTALPDNQEGFDFVTFMSVLTTGSLLLMLLEHVLVGYWEELVFRGYVFQNMIDGLGLVVAIVISCIIYGIIHHTNPNATMLSSIIIAGFGFLRIYGYLGTKMLWLSMGMHMGWNFFQGPIFGFAASGHKKATLLNHTFTSDKEFLTGGEFGPEGSVIIIPILILALLIMRWYARVYYPNQGLRLKNKRVIS